MISPDAPGQAERLDRVEAALAHRGPDGSGRCSRAGVSLVHTRLAIIDPARGQQPMQTPDGSLAVVFNGEIYNFRELRSELQRLGIQFQTDSDTEVLLYAYQTWGEACFLRFRGMFAVGIHDRTAGCLVLARDPFGVKPLVYAQTENGFFFSSEIPALMAFGGISREISSAAVRDYFAFGYIPAPATIYAGVRKLEPATILRVTTKDLRMTQRRYWQMEFAPEHGIDPRSWVEEIDATVTRVVERSLVADVPFGLFLSGGIDSSLVAAKMVHALGRDVHAFCIGFEEEAYDESLYAQNIADALGMPLRVQRISGHDVSNLEQVVGAYGEPFSDASAVPTWSLCCLARREFPMVLSGDGGDELFGGYARFDQWAENQSTNRRALAYQVKHRRWRAALASAKRSLEQAASGAGWFPYVALFTEEEQKELLQERAAGSSPSFRQTHRHYRRENALSYAQGMDITTYLPGAVLTKVDIASMAQGLEVRPPLLDLDLAALAGRIPADLHRDCSRQVGEQGKTLLKQCLGKSLPRGLWDRPKRGFGLSHEVGFLPGGGLRARLEAILQDSGHPLHHFLQAPFVKCLLDRHALSHQEAPRLWSVLVFATWLQQEAQIRSAA